MASNGDIAQERFSCNTNRQIGSPASDSLTLRPKVTFSECELALDDRPVRQGDVVRFRDPSDDWGRLGVIVTGDCDIARNKHAGRLTYVPIVTVQKYLAYFWLPARLDRVKTGLSESLVRIMHQAQQANRPDFAEPMTPERSLEWLVERGACSVGATLHIEDVVVHDFLSFAQAYIELSSVTLGDFDAAWTSLIDGLVVLGRKKTPEDATSSTLSDIAGHLRSLPGDALFLSSLGGPEDGGYVCYLRILRDVQDTEIATRPSPWLRGAPAKRIAHLKPPYVYRLTQQLADVFAAIGLPEEYETSRDRMAEGLLRPHLLEELDP